MFLQGTDFRCNELKDQQNSITFCNELGFDIFVACKVYEICLYLS